MNFKKPTIFACAILLCGVFFPVMAQAATRVWDGGGGDNNWSTAANWSDDTLPGSSDTAVFNGTSTKDCTIDTAFTVLNLQINSGYTGTISPSGSPTITMRTFTQADGTFTSTPGNMALTSNNRYNAAVFTHTGGTFNHNNGTITITPHAGSGSVITSNGQPFYDLVGVFANTFDDFDVGISLKDDLLIENDFTISNTSDEAYYVRSGTASLNPELTILGDLIFPDTPGTNASTRIGYHTASLNITVSLAGSRIEYDDDMIYYAIFKYMVGALPSGDHSLVLASDGVTDITSIGQTGTQTVRLQKSGIPIVDAAADFSESRDWSSVTAETSTSTHKAVVNFSGNHGHTGTHTLYVPRVTGSQEFRLCPNATNIGEVNDACSGGVVFSGGFPENQTVGSDSVTVSQVTIDDNDYWKVEGVSGTGGQDENGGGGGGEVPEFSWWAIVMLCGGLWLIIQREKSLALISA